MSASVVRFEEQHAMEAAGPLPTPDFPDGTPITLRTLIERGQQLAPLPATVAQLLRILEDPDVRMDLVVSHVERDQGLAAAVLRMANSVFYRRLREVTSLDMAVPRIGLSTVRDLALASTMFSGPYAVTALVRELRDEMLITAIGSRVLAAQVALEPGTAFAAGLFLSVGRYCLALTAPEAYAIVRERARLTGIPLDDLEHKWLNLHQGRIGSALVAAWGFPEALVNVLALQARFNRNVEGPDVDAKPYVYVAAAVLARDLAEVLCERAPRELASVDVLAQHPSTKVLELDRELLVNLYDEVRAAVTSVTPLFGEQ
jgi:HD-like signal output (HDOD) protein